MDLKLLFEETELPHPPKWKWIEPVVPNSFSGVAVIGDVPYDENAVQPFTNAWYGTIAGLLRHAGGDLRTCLQANIMRSAVKNHTITEDRELEAKSGVEDLYALLQTYKPRVIFLLGRQTLKYFKENCAPLDDERGAPFKWRGFVCVPTYHPRELYAEWHYYNVVLADYQKGLRYARDGWEPPQYSINYQPTYPECVHFLRQIIEKRPYMTVDAETQENPVTGQGYLTCIGFSVNTKSAFVIPFVRSGNKPYFTLPEEIVIWRLLATALEKGRFLGQNAVHYDHWYLAYWCKILLNVVDDAMFAHWEVYTELPKSLAFQSSLYTDNEYHKDLLKASRSGKVPREMEFYYCGLDNIINFQCAVAIGKDLKELPPAVKSHYRFNIRCSRVFQYMSLRGARINRDLLSDRLKALEEECKEQQDLLNSQAKKPIMVTSHKKMKAWLYDELKLPVKYKQVKLDDGSVEDRESADFLSLMYLAREYPDLPFLTTAANLRKLKKRISTLNSAKLGPNGEVYWNFNLVGTDSGRAAGYKPWNGLGMGQSMNVDRRDRDLYLPPAEGQLWGKCDLEGADAWTIAAQLAKLGDDTMLKDLLAGLKPAMILAVAREFGEHYITADVSTIKEVLTPEVKKKFKTDPRMNALYETTKAVSHGTNYMMQANTMHVTVFRKSKGEIYIPVRECETLRLLYLTRYSGLKKLYDHIPTIINTHGYIDCPSGMRRVFFGRPDNHRTRVGLSLLPQNNTAYATNRFLENIFYQQYNRRSDGVTLVVEPINQVHDEADIAFYENELPLVRRIVELSTQFVSECWGLEFKIPFDPNIGPNWGECTRDLFEEPA